MSLVPRHRFTDLHALSLRLQLSHWQSEILGWGYFEPEWWRNYLHIHSFFEVCYVYQGRGLFHICDRDYNVQAGDVFVAKPGEPHEIISSEDDPLGIYFWSYTLLPDDNAAQEASETDILLRTFLTSDQWVSQHTPAMERTLELLTEEIVRREVGYDQVIPALVTKLLLDTARAVTHIEAPPQTDKPVYNPGNALVQEMLRYLHDNYTRPLLLRDVAAQVHLSQRHTNRLFHRAMGTSIRQYLTTFRLEVAAQLLLNRSLSITEIAEATGFNDVRYFTTLFHRRMGLTPSRFRQKRGTHRLSTP
jgi:AraC-like DNA-binding protein